MSQYEASAGVGSSARQQPYSAVAMDSRRSSSESASTVAEKHKSSMILSSHRKRSLSSESGATANLWLNEVMDSLEGIHFDSHHSAVDSVDLSSERDSTTLTSLPMGGSLAGSSSSSSSSSGSGSTPFSCGVGGGSSSSSSCSSSSSSASMMAGSMPASGILSTPSSTAAGASSMVLDESGKAIGFGIIFEENHPPNLKQGPPSKRRKSSSFASGAVSTTASRKHSLSHSATSQISLASVIASEPCAPPSVSSADVCSRRTDYPSTVGSTTMESEVSSDFPTTISGSAVTSAVIPSQSEKTMASVARFSSYLPESLKKSRQVVDPSLFEFDELEDMIGDGKSSTVYRISMRGHTQDLALKRISKFELSSRKWFLNECSVMDTLNPSMGSDISRSIPGSSVSSSSSSFSSSSATTTSSSDRDLLKDLDGGGGTGSSSMKATLEGVCKIQFIAADARFYYLVLELGTTDLFNRILSMRGIKETRVKPMISSLLETIDLLHREFGLVHMDLKPENIVFTRSEPWIPKLIDFSEHLIVDDSDDSVSYSCDECGTLVYTSPERWKGKCTGSELKKSDIWSVGVIVYECLTAARCFSGSTKTTISANVTQGVWGFPERMRGKSVSAMCKAFVSYLLILDPKRRPSARLALAHPWFKL